MTAAHESLSKQQSEIITQRIKHIRGQTGLRFCIEEHENGRYTLGLMSTRHGMQILAFRVSYDACYESLNALSKFIRVEHGDMSAQ